MITAHPTLSRLQCPRVASAECVWIPLVSEYLLSVRNGLAFLTTTTGPTPMDLILHSPLDLKNVTAAKYANYSRAMLHEPIRNFVQPVCASDMTCAALTTAAENVEARHT